METELQTEIQTEKKYKNNWVLASITAVILIIIDQFTKWIAINNLKPIGSVEIIKGFMDFTFVENRGVAFGMLSGRMNFILIMTIAISIGLVLYYKSLPQTDEYFYMRKCLILIFAGAIGNLMDRAFRGYVVDFFDVAFFDFPVFNVADCYVVVGSVLLMILVMFFIEDEANSSGIEDEEKGE